MTPPLKKRSSRSSGRLIRPPMKPPADETPWSDETSDIDPDYCPSSPGESMSTSVTLSEYSTASIESDSDSST